MAQALGRVRLYAVSGILCAALVVGLNILLLSVFRLGVTGYVLSNVIADALSALLLFFALRLWRYFRPAALKRSLIKRMFRYCLPLIPTSICTWTINISDRYFISYLIGSDISGLYAIANKISTIFSLSLEFSLLPGSFPLCRTEQSQNKNDSFPMCFPSMRLAPLSALLF